MTPLDYIASNPTYEDSRTKWLVFTAANKTSMIAKQNGLSTNHRIAPIELTDGRWAVCCDVVTELGDRGVFKALFAQLDKGKLNTAEIISQAEFEALKPIPDEIS